MPELPFEAYRDFDFAILSICSSMTVLCLPGWKESRGVEAEVVEAKRLCLPITMERDHAS